MKLTQIATSCGGTDPKSCGDGVNCPAVHATDGPLSDQLKQVDDGTAVVQGYVVKDPQALSALSLPDGEGAVEIPLSLLLAAAARMSEEGSG